MMKPAFLVFTAGLLASGCGQTHLAGPESSTGQSGIVRLPEPVRKGTMSVEQALAERRSIREYGDAELTLAQVGQLLWAAYGITQPIEKPGWLRGGLKTAPSAGALYPLELYIVAGKVTGLAAGVYRYRPESHDLVLVKSGNRRAELCAAAYGQASVRNAPVSIVYSAVFERTTAKYGNRGRERYVCMDLGHSAENVYLQCVSLGLGTVAIGAFQDADVKTAVGMPKEEEPLYIMPVGRTRGAE
ncbi:MAG: SagB/ThcOx family dehydrogenase [candidate division WOR-3 bacterium]